MHTVEKILQAAEQRFADYGPCKTTMAEIAADCNMSVGNLYRHFKNKEAILVASMELQLQQRLDVGIAAVQEENNALEALRKFLQRRLVHGHGQFANKRHLFDLISIVNMRHRDVLLAFEQKIIDVIAAILSDGVTQQRFSCSNPHQMAYDIHQATQRYNNPIALKNNSLDSLCADLNRLIDLLYLGLKIR